jgi:hypothetical protein
MSRDGYQLFRMLNNHVDDRSRQEGTTFLAECSENDREPFYGFRFSEFSRLRGFLTAACLYWRESPSHILSTHRVDGLISRD